MGGWRNLVDGFGGTLAAAAVGDPERGAPTAPFGDQADATGRPRLPGLSSQDPMVRDITLARIRRRDPGFEPDAVLQGAVAAFRAVEQAWTELDPQRSRQYLSGPLWCSHRSRMELYALHDRRNRLEGLAVRTAVIVGAECGEAAESLTVRIGARSADYDVDAAGNIVRGDRRRYDWEEDWVLQRSATSMTPPAGGVLAQRCPNCGAPLAVDDGGCCSTCRAPVMDGSRDWVVVAVERCDEQRRRLDAVLGVRTVTLEDDQGRPLPCTTVVPHGMTQLRQTASGHDPAALGVLHAADPDFAPADLCDHARNAFTAVRQAWGAMDADRARPYLSESAWATLHQAIADERARGLHRVADDPLVDGVRITGATDTDGFLTVVCEITAELVDGDADASGAPVRGSNGLQHVTCELTFRRHDIARSPGSGISLLRCPRCGAPLRATVLEPCPYCKQAAADGGGSWALTDVGALTPRRPTPPREAGPAVLPASAPLAALTAADPTFNVFEILATARELFYAVEASAAHLDAGAVADRLTPRALAQLAERLERLRASGHTLRLAFLELTGAAVAGGAVQPDGSLRVTVRFAVSGDASEVDAAGTLVSGSGRVTTWSEEWDLARAGRGSSWLVDAMRPVSPPAAT